MGSKSPAVSTLLKTQRLIFQQPPTLLLYGHSICHILDCNMINIKVNEPTASCGPHQRLWKFKIRLIVLLAVLVACSYLNSCAPHTIKITGQVEAFPASDTLSVEYDIHVRGNDIDSIAIQLLPKFNHRSVWYEVESRVKDSLYRSLGDSLDCCFTQLRGRLISQLRDSLSDTAEILPTTPPLCWWIPTPDTSANNLPYPPLPYYSSMYRMAYIDSILESGHLDSLRKLSIPCTWGTADTSHDTILQSDSILYRKGINPENDGLRVTGTLNYFPFDRVQPSAYCLKLYIANMEQSDFFIDPLVSLWEGIIPRRPRTKLYRFQEQGGFLGMAGGMGISKFSRSDLASANTSTDFMPAFTIGFSYYSPSAIYQFSGELFGTDSSRNVTSLSTISPLGIRHYPFTRNSAGWSWYGAVEFTTFKAESGTGAIEDKSFGLEIGVGYDTDFDRITYSYHTNQGGYHEMEFLAGLVALQQGKAGLKVSFLKGNIIQFATIQAYMENRIDFQTMEFHRSHSLPVQALIYASIIAVWAAVY